jgi:DNA-directed RNA polymerase subunit RPC12/RpoP
MIQEIYRCILCGLEFFTWKELDEHRCMERK